MTAVILVDDHAVIREALSRLLEADPRLSVVGQAGTLAEGRDLVLAGPLPDDGADTVLLCDVSLPDGSGLSLVREARAMHRRMGIVVLTMHEDDETLLGALDAGASSLVRKSTPAERVVEAIQTAALNPSSFSAEGLGQALRRSRDQQAATPLTPRETEVLRHIANGESIQQVARALFMSESTAKTHVAKIYGKLGAHNRASAVRAAISLGLVEL